MLKIMSEQKKPGLHRPVEQYYETPHKTDSSQNAENAALPQILCKHQIPIHQAPDLTR